MIRLPVPYATASRRNECTWFSGFQITGQKMVFKSLELCVISSLLVSTIAFTLSDEGGRELQILKEDLQSARSTEERDNLFKEELRSAMNSHWEILQNIRYHTLISKMKVAQLDAKVRALAQQIEEMGSGKLAEKSPGEPCDEKKKEGSTGERGQEQTEGDNDLMDIQRSLKELSSLYQNFNYSTATFDRPMESEGGFEELLGTVDRLKNLIEKLFQNNHGKRLTKKSTKHHNVTVTTAATSTGTTVALPDDNGAYVMGTKTPNVKITSGSTVSLKCRVTTRGFSTVVWTKLNHYGGYDILAAGQYVYSNDPRHSILYDAESKDWVLTIRSVTQNDQGTYKCEVNSDPSVTTYVHLTVSANPGPKIIPHLEDSVSARKGTTASLTCRVSNLGSFDLAWTEVDPKGNSVKLTHNEMILINDSRYEIIHLPGSDDWILTIKDVTEQDEGLYTCEVNSVPAISHKMSLTVLGGGPSIIPSDTNSVTTQLGSTASLHCRVNNLGSYTVGWSRVFSDGSTELLTFGTIIVSRNSRLSVTSDSEFKDWTLTIREVSTNDVGEYLCQVDTNPALSQSVTLHTEEKDEDPYIISSNVNNTSVQIGSTAYLHCRIANLGSYKVAWTKVDQQGGSDILTVGQRIVSWNPRINVTYDPQLENWILLIKEVTVQDGGEYTCQVNTYPVLYQSVTLNIQEKDEEPYIIPSYVNNASVQTGSTASLHCRVANLGSYTVAWTKVNQQGGSDILTVGQTIMDWNPRINVTYDPQLEDWILLIKKLAVQDGGEYKCQLNTNPVIYQSVTLNIQEPEVVGDTMHLPRNLSVAESEVAILPCHVKNLGDASVSWVRSSDLQILTAGEFTLSLDGRFQTQHIESEIWQLQITDVRLDDEGEYVCQISTDPVTTHRFWLTVNGKAKHAVNSGSESIPSSTESSIIDQGKTCLQPFELISGGLCILHVSLEKLSWSDASHYCVSKGGGLGIDVHGIIQAFLEEQHGVQGENWTRWPFWVGAKEERDPSGERSWHWLDGTPVKYTKWAQNQPRKFNRRNSPEGTCMFLNGYEGYAASALPCHYKRRFVCLAN